MEGSPCGGNEARFLSPRTPRALVSSFLEWWRNSPQHSAASAQSTVVPPPPRSAPPASTGCALPVDPTICPLCSRPRVNTTVVAASGECHVDGRGVTLVSVGLQRFEGRPGYKATTFPRRCSHTVCCVLPQGTPFAIPASMPISMSTVDVPLPMSPPTWRAPSSSMRCPEPRDLPALNHVLHGSLPSRAGPSCSGIRYSVPVVEVALVDFYHSLWN